MAAEILVGDCLEVMRALGGGTVDSIVTDPPYHLTTGKKGGTGPASVNLESPYGRARIGTGFMGMKWDGGDVAMRPETWAEALRVAKPGAFLVAFGGTRTYHRMACAIEDAGWELRDTLMWVYGSGFPKSHNGEWGGTALKPAWEPIVLARKPLIGTVEANWHEYGTGALNIDPCRVSTAESLEGGATGRRTALLTMSGENGRPNHARAGEPSADRRYTDAGGTNFAATPGPRGGDPLGRWPANVLHDGSDEVLAAFPDAPGQQRDTGPEFERNAQVYGTFAGVAEHKARGDSGSAARFFYCAKASRADRNDGCDGMLRSLPRAPNGAENAVGASRGSLSKPRENIHPTVKPTDLMRWLCRLVTPAGGLVLDPFAGSGSTGRGAILEGLRFTGIELSEDYAAIARARLAAAEKQRAIETAQGSLFGQPA